MKKAFKVIGKGWVQYKSKASIISMSKIEKAILIRLGSLLNNKAFWINNKVGESTLLLNYELFKLGTQQYSYKVYAHNSVPRIKEKRKIEWQNKFNKLVQERERKRNKGSKRENENKTNPKDIKFVNRELLVDLHWFEEQDHTSFISTKLPLVAESEWSFKRPDLKINRSNSSEVVQTHSEAFYDFQKLLYTNAKLRLLIFRLRNPKDLTELHKEFSKRVLLYEGLPNRSKILLAAYHIENGNKTLFYSRIKKL